MIGTPSERDLESSFTRSLSPTLFPTTIKRPQQISHSRIMTVNCLYLPQAATYSVPCRTVYISAGGRSEISLCLMVLRVALTLMELSFIFSTLDMALSPLWDYYRQKCEFFLNQQVFAHELHFPTYVILGPWKTMYPLWQSQNLSVETRTRYHCCGA